MRMYRVSDNKTFADPCELAESMVSRFWGLMGRSSLEPGSGLLLRPCNSIHTFFMRFAIDVVYLDRELKVLRVRRGMKPWRMDFPVARAAAVLELPADAAAGLSVGDLLCLS